jgi:hypothetical protein
MLQQDRTLDGTHGMAPHPAIQHFLGNIISFWTCERYQRHVSNI